MLYEYVYDVYVVRRIDTCYVRRTPQLLKSGCERLSVQSLRKWCCWVSIIMYLYSCKYVHGTAGRTSCTPGYSVFRTAANYLQAKDSWLADSNTRQYSVCVGSFLCLLHSHSVPVSSLSSSLQFVYSIFGVCCLSTGTVFPLLHTILFYQPTLGPEGAVARFRPSCKERNEKPTTC